MRHAMQRRDGAQEEAMELARGIESAEVGQKQIQRQIESLRSEQGMPLNARLSREEKAEITTLNERIKVRILTCKAG